MIQSNKMNVDPKAILALQNFQLPESSKIVFGQLAAPIMITCDYQNKSWGKLNLLPYGPLSIDPAMKVLHYGQEIFEGMKAYHGQDKGPRLFRPIENWKRFNLSASVMAMPEIPQDIFMEAVIAFASYMSPYIPEESGTSLYIRPFMVASEVSLGIKPAESFKFLVIGSPAGKYFTSDQVEVLIEREMVRAYPGGTGHVKTGGNYARSLKASIKAKEKGMHQVLWLDALEHEYIEELSGMNFFAVIKGELYTPPLSGTILAGITRDSILKVAKNLNLKVHESKISISKLLKQVKSGECSEAFACGTAAIVAPFSSFNEENGEKYKLPSATPVTDKIREHLLGIQEGRVESPKDWIVSVPPASWKKIEICLKKKA